MFTPFKVSDKSYFCRCMYIYIIHYYLAFNFLFLHLQELNKNVNLLIINSSLLLFFVIFSSSNIWKNNITCTCIIVSVNNNINATY